MELNLLSPAIILISFLLSTFPLYRALQFANKKRKFLRVFLITVYAGILVALIEIFVFIYTSLISTIVLIHVYKKYFKLSYKRATLVWIIQLIWIAITSAIMAFLFSLI